MSDSCTVVAVRLLNNAVGTLFIGCSVNLVLFGFELSQLYFYFANFPHDHALTRFLVAFMFFVDCVATLNACIMVYLVIYPS